MSAAIVQAMYEAFGRGDVPAILAHLASDVVWRINAPSVVPYAGECRGREAVSDWFGTLAQSENITSFAPEIFVASKSHVVAIGSAAGTARPTGRTWSIRWAHVWTFQTGRVTAFEDILDSAAIAAAFA
jgi:ketosteroid isomerase-like protein